jgi:5-methylcytosine-specific restriction protein A
MPGRIGYYQAATHTAAQLAAAAASAERRAANAAVYRAGPERAEDNRFYSSRRWRRLRALFLAAHPLCAECSRQGRTQIATDVHHKRERKQDPDRALDWSNLEALCRACHNAKRRED